MTGSRGRRPSNKALNLPVTSLACARVAPAGYRDVRRAEKTPIHNRGLTSFRLGGALEHRKNARVQCLSDLLPDN
jgi:hypothetical protein